MSALARVAIALLAAFASCSRVEVCELVFRAAPSETVDAHKLDATCGVLRTRLAPEGRILLGHVVPSGASEIRVRLVSEPDADTLAWLKRCGEHAGRMRFLAVAGARTPDYDEVEEQGRYGAWRSEHAADDVAVFNRLPRDSGGPLPEIEWHLARVSTSRPAPEAALACERPTDPASTFTTSDLGRVFPSADESGLPAIGFEMSAKRRSDFADFSRRLLKQRIAILYDGEILTSPTIESPLLGAAIVRGDFTEPELDEMIAILKSGELPVALEFVELRKLK